MRQTPCRGLCSHLADTMHSGFLKFDSPENRNQGFAKLLDEMPELKSRAFAPGVGDVVILENLKADELRALKGLQLTGAQWFDDIQFRQMD